MSREEHPSDQEEQGAWQDHRASTGLAIVGMWCTKEFLIYDAMLIWDISAGKDDFVRIRIHIGILVFLHWKQEGKEI